MIYRSKFALLPLLFLMTGCLGTMDFDRALFLSSIQDLPGPEDVVLINAEHVEGQSAGYYSMALPADWKSRRAEPQLDGFPVLEPAVTPVWKPLGRYDFNRVRPQDLVGGERIPWRFLTGDLTVEEATLMASERLAQGSDSYWFGPIEESGDPAVWTCALLGARPKGTGATESLAQPSDEVEWVQLCMLEFQDARSASRRKWTRMGSELGAGTGMLFLVGVPLAVWFIILD